MFNAFIKRFWLPAMILGLAAAAQAEIRLHGLFTDHMVLQQGQPVPVWGWADDGEAVAVSFRGHTVSAYAQNGRWRVLLPAMKAGGPNSLVVSGKNTLTLNDVMVGEVWICSGQSNMEWPTRASFQPEQDIATATNGRIRLYKVPNLRLPQPTNNVAAAWEVCSPKAVTEFSAVGYYFGRALQPARKVAIGLIEPDWGGSPAEAWMSREALQANPRYKAEILDAYPGAIERWKVALAAWEKEKAEAEKAGKEFKKWGPWKPWYPSELYNGMIAPLAPYAIKGALWYQGESNAGQAEQYRTLFPDMIRNWRLQWGQEFPFLCVQLAPFKAIQPQPGESDWAELRDAQRLATQVLPKVGMAVITDVGDPKDIHPSRKQPVGARLALAARALAYGEKLAYSGPDFASLKIEGSKAVLSFNHVGKGLTSAAPGGAGSPALTGFALCGQDRKWAWGQAEIVGQTVVVTSPEVPAPVAVRYGWADCPVVNLWNKDGLPASPFRTDDFPLTTARKPQ